MSLDHIGIDLQLGWSRNLMNGWKRTLASVAQDIQWSSDDMKRIFQGKTWNSPTLAGRFLLVRTDREAACYEMPVEPAILSAHEFSSSDSKRKRDSL